VPKDALADILYEWRSLVTALDELLAHHPDPALRRKRDEIAAMLAYTEALANEQSSLAVYHQVITKELRIAKSRGKDLAIQVRHLLKGHFGHRNVALARFHIRPVRRRSRAMQEKSDVATVTHILGVDRLLALMPSIQGPGSPLAFLTAPTADEAEPAAVEATPNGEDGAPADEAASPTAEEVPPIEP
jgi:hypothetical protein